MVAGRALAGAVLAGTFVAIASVREVFETCAVMTTMAGIFVTDAGVSETRGAVLVDARWYRLE